MSKKIIIVIVLVLALLASLTLVFRTTIFVNRAAVYSDNTPVLSNSYLFASPLQANTKIGEKIRVTVFILDNQGMGVANQTINLTTTPFLDIEAVSPITNETGQAVFNLSTSTPGKYTISAKIGSQQIPQSISLTYY